MTKMKPTFIITILAATLLLPFPLQAEEEKLEGGAAETNDTAAVEKAKESGVPSEEEFKEMRRRVERLVPADMGPEAAAEYEQLMKMVDYFNTEAAQFKKDIQSLIERKYEEKRRKIEGSYEKAIRELEDEEKIRREEAIARFEAFLKRYPNDENYTPDALFRLAELFFEKSDQESSKAVEQYYKDLERYEKGELTVEPTEPRQDYSKMVTIYYRLLNQFPEYRYNDAVTYLLGFCLDKMGEKDEARKIFTRLVTEPRYKDSRYVVESWMLLGESYFDEGDPEFINKAIEAYKMLLTNLDYVNYDKVLYKLAWAYYRLDMFPDAVATFIRLIDLYEKKKAELLAKGEKVEEGVLRPESIRYIAISYSDENWSGGGVENAMAYFKLIGNRPYEREIFQALGEVFEDYTKYENAIAAYKIVLDMDALHEKNPEIQNKIINAFLKLRNFNAAAKERELLVATYRPGSDWYEKNKDNPVALKAANDLTENSLAEAAYFYHQQAMNLMKDGKEKEAVEFYRLAAINYGKYLERFPHEKTSYEMNYYYADALIFAGDFEGAAVEFERVRNSTAGTKYKAEAADRAVRAYNQAVIAAIKAGKIQERPFKQFKGADTDPKVEPAEIPPLIQRLIDAGKSYLQLVPEGETAPLAMYVAAEYYFRYDQHDKTREACEQIIKKYPTHEFSRDATNLMLETYLAVRDWDNVQKWAEIKAQASTADSGEFMKLANSAVFKKAEVLRDQSKFEDAAKEFLRVIARDPKFEYADAALNNAAIMYEKVYKFDTALSLYERLYKEYPNSKMADQALFRVAVNAERSWNFERAIQGYQLLFNKYAQSKEREKALYNAAINLEYIQNYKAAAREYLRFHSNFSNSELAPGALFDAAMVHQKMNDDRGALQLFQRFIKEYNKDPRQGARVIRAHYEMSKIYKTQRDPKSQKAAREECATIIREYEKRGLQNDPRSSNYAAECVFDEAMVLFDNFSKMPIGHNKPEILKKQLEDKAKAREEVEKAFQKVYAYKAAEWTLASAYKIGHSFQVFATSLLESPIPRELRGDFEAQDAYKIMLEELAMPIQDKATQYYRAAYELCKQFNVFSVWVNRIEEALANYLPSEFPLLKEPQHHLKQTQLSYYSYRPIKPEEKGGAALEEEGKLKESEPTEAETKGDKPKEAEKLKSDDKVEKVKPAETGEEKLGG